MNDLELHEFYENLVRTLRSKGVLCAITSGLACVHYGIAESTKDCNLLCHTSSFGTLLDLLAETKVEGAACRYRGNISPPLDARWHKGGWTSHFEWPGGAGALLDAFGSSLREALPWEDDTHGLYAGLQVVAYMKRTDRDKDWPFISSIGEQMLLRQDGRGWLHLYDADLLMELAAANEIPDELLGRRPLLQLVRERSEELRYALSAERTYWQELDHLRMRILRGALRPYVLAVGKAGRGQVPAFREQHRIRVEQAEAHLDPRPLASYGIDRFIETARANTLKSISAGLVKWLPDLTEHFRRFA